jgi:hypothetical protein
MGASLTVGTLGVAMQVLTKEEIRLGSHKIPRLQGHHSVVTASR